TSDVSAVANAASTNRFRITRPSPGLIPRIPWRRTYHGRAHFHRGDQEDAENGRDLTRSLNPRVLVRGPTDVRLSFPPCVGCVDNASYVGAERIKLPRLS